MDYFDQRAPAALEDGKPQSFAEIQNQAGFSHNTLQLHLKRLIEKGFVPKGKDPSRGFGRPRYVYHVPSKTAKQVAAALEDPVVEPAALPFSLCLKLRAS